MGVFPVLAGFFAFLNVLTIWAGGGLLLQVPILCVTVFFAIVGLAKPGEESPANGRVMSIFAILFALLPFVKPYAEEWAYRRRERARAAETAPMYQTLQQKLDTYDDELFAFHEKWGQYPPMNGPTLMPMVGPKGELMRVDPKDAPQPPLDSFTLSSPMAVIPVGTVGALVMSVGQDGTVDYPTMKYMISLDGQPNDPLAPLAWQGMDIRELTYDPSNGALAPGDIANFVTKRDLKRDDLFKRLYAAWDQVHALTPLPKKKDDKEWVPPADIDADNARKMIDDGEWLAAIAFSTRAIQNRRPHPNFWQQYPNLMRADYYKGYALFQLGHYRSAADAFIDYVAIVPNDAEAHYWLAAALYNGRDTEAARRHFAASFQMDPKNLFAQKAAAAYVAIGKNQLPELPRPWILDHPEVYDPGGQANAPAQQVPRTPAANQ